MSHESSSSSSSAESTHKDILTKVNQEHSKVITKEKKKKIREESELEEEEPEAPYKSAFMNGIGPKKFARRSGIVRVGKAKTVNARSQYIVDAFFRQLAVDSWRMASLSQKILGAKTNKKGGFALQPRHIRSAAKLGMNISLTD